MKTMHTLRLKISLSTSIPDTILDCIPYDSKEIIDQEKIF